jgi:hypothetical protein
VKFRLIASLCSTVALLHGVSLFADESVDYQARADQAKWDWNKDKTELAYYVKACEGMFEVTAAKSAPEKPWSDYTLQVSEAKKVLYETKVHGSTAFRIRGNTLYLTKFHRYANGCALVAIDLSTKSQVWQTPLQGIGAIPHFKYSNQVTLDLDGPVAIVYGNESAGNYIEFVDLKTGKTVGNRRFE